MKALYKIRTMICDELKTIAEQGALTTNTLETVDKLTHSLKSIDTVLAMEDKGYSEDYMPRYETRPVYYGGRYSRDAGNARLVERLRSMMSEASNEKERSAIKDCISHMEG